MLPALAGAREMASYAPGEGADSGSARFELNELTIADLQTGITSGKYSARSLTEKYLARIEQIDRRGPAVNSVIELNPDALAIAETLDKERKDKARTRTIARHSRADQGQHRYGRPDADHGRIAGACWGRVRHEDSFVAQKLREAGAVILGKTNLSEWANIRSSHSVSGWSGRGGQTRNPYALDRNPCGSSSGSGAAIAANLCARRGGHGNRWLGGLSVDRRTGSSGSNRPWD